MAYTLGDRMRDIAKAYEKNSHLVDQLDKELTEKMFEVNNFRTSFQFADMNEQSCRPYTIELTLEHGCKDDYYGTIEYTKFASAMLYINVEGSGKATIHTSAVNIAHYDWISEDVLSRFFALINAAKKIVVYPAKQKR